MRFCLKWNDVVGKGGLGTVKGYYPPNIKKLELDILKDFASKSYLDELGQRIKDANKKVIKTEKNRLTRIRDRGRKKFDLLVIKYKQDNYLESIQEMIEQRLKDENQNCVLFEIGIKVKIYTEVFSKDINTEIQDTVTILNKRNIMEETPVINPNKTVQNNLNNIKNKTMTTTTPSVIRKSKRQQAKEKNLIAETIWNNSIKAVGKTLQQIKEKTGKLE